MRGKGFEAVGADTLRAGRFFGQRAVCKSLDVLVCKLIDDNVTYVHRRVWAALMKVAQRFGKERLAKIWDEHTKGCAHVARRIPFRNGFQAL